MPITLSPMTPGFACEVGDVDLSRPLPDDTLAEVRRASAERRRTGTPFASAYLRTKWLASSIMSCVRSRRAGSFMCTTLRR